MPPKLPELTWPTSVLGPLPTAREIRFACACSLACAVLILVIALAAGRDRVASLGLPYEEDFVAFYGIGRLLNEHPADRLYDFRVQEEIYRELRPGAKFLGLPYVHAPFEAILFQPLARLPYEVAYVAWLMIGMVAYAGALVAVTRRFGPRIEPDRSTVFLLAFAFSPYMMESWIGGNVAVLPFLAMALAISLEDAGRPILGGFALALCLNKPSLLVLILPMLFVSRRVSVLAGFVAGAAALVVSSSMLLGTEVWLDFVGSLLRWAQMTASQPGLFRDWKYVDLNAFSRVLPGGRSWLGQAILIGGSCWALYSLLRMWLALPRAGREGRALAWAAVITWTLVLNPYVPIYDCTILVLAGIVAGGALRDPVSGAIPPALSAIVAVCFLSAWVTQPIAQLLRIQIYTLVLIYTGAFLLAQFHRVQSGPASRNVSSRVGS